jgi:hypothetical protein
MVTLIGACTKVRSMASPYVLATSASALSLTTECRAPPGDTTNFVTTASRFATKARATWPEHRSAIAPTSGGRQERLSRVSAGRRRPGCGRLADVLLATVSFYYGHRDPVSVAAG